MKSILPLEKELKVQMQNRIFQIIIVCVLEQH